MLISADATHSAPSAAGRSSTWSSTAPAQVLRDGLPGDALDIPLGPEIGQCCGGRVEVALRVVDDSAGGRPDRPCRSRSGRPSACLSSSAPAMSARRWRAALAPLPLHTSRHRHAPRRARRPAGRRRGQGRGHARGRRPLRPARLQLRHPHPRPRARFPDRGRGPAARTTRPTSAWSAVEDQAGEVPLAGTSREGGDPDAAAATCPADRRRSGLGDKRPEVIAALAAAEILVHIGRGEASNMRVPGSRIGLGAAVE